MKQPDLSAYVKPLFHQAFLLSGSSQQAQDLMQDTFLQALSALNRGVRVENCGAWLAAILRRRWYRMLREKYRSPVMLFDVPQDDEDCAPALDEALLETEALGGIRRELAHLASDYRKAAVMHYLEGKSVAEIATTLGVPKGTVLSRLDAGRKQIRRNMDMSHEYGKRSLQPETLSFGINGQVGGYHEPFDAIKGILAQNILLAAYPDPQTPQRLAAELGIALPYMEDEIERLVKSELMVRLDGGRVRTDFAIRDSKSSERMLSAVRQHVAGAIGAIWPEVRKAADTLAGLPGFTSIGREDIACFILAETNSHYGETIRKIKGLANLPFSDYPLRPHGGRWIASGMRSGGEPDKASREVWKYSVSGRLTSEQVDEPILLIADWDFELGRTHSRYHFQWNLDQNKIARVLYSIHTGRQESLDEASLAMLPRLEELRLLERAAGSWKVRVPILTPQENGEMQELAGKTAERILSSLPDLYDQLNDVAPRVPKGILTSHPLQHDGFNYLPMAILYSAMEEGFLKLDQAVNHPVMYLVVR